MTASTPTAEIAAHENDILSIALALEEAAPGSLFYIEFRNEQCQWRRTGGVAPTGPTPRQRGSDASFCCWMERGRQQTVEVPMPQILKEIVEAVAVVPCERVQQWTAEQIVDVPAMEWIGEVETAKSLETPASVTGKTMPGFEQSTRDVKGHSVQCRRTYQARGDPDRDRQRAHRLVVYAVPAPVVEYMSAAPAVTRQQIPSWRTLLQRFLSALWFQHWRCMLLLR